MVILKQSISGFLMLNRVSKHLDNWKGAYYSMGSQIAHNQACLSSIPSHYLPRFQIMVRVTQRIEKMDFLWSGVVDEIRAHPVIWEICCRLRMKGDWMIGSCEFGLQSVILVVKWYVGFL